MKKAARAVDSLSDTEFNISFNPDLFQPQVTHAQPEVGFHRRPVSHKINFWRNACATKTFLPTGPLLLNCVFLATDTFVLKSYIF